MDCINDTATAAMGVFFGWIRGKSVVLGKTVVHRGMVYVIEGNKVIILLLLLS